MTGSPAELRARAQSASAHLPALILSAERLAAMVAPGAHGLRRGGPGEDFWQYRPASQGDTARAIDWRRSARSDSQFVRDREAQTAQAVGLWVSAGQGMAYSGAPDRPTKADRAQLLALALAMVLLRGGEKVGLLGQPARAGRVQADRLAQQIVARRPQGGDGDAPAADHLRPNQRLVILSDFLDDPSWVDDLLARASGMGVTGVLMQVLDPDEEVFPWTGAVLFRSLSGAFRHDSRDAGGLREAYLARLAERRDWLRRRAEGAGWHWGHHRTDHPPAVALSWLYQVLAG
ncbi:DUF58 domain-containing protein [Paracoccus benzoatiresistens]|uniref:DUF58 domain-containing protein n=1 Tax=Paracoccus benzoatiresistens TaxID=2997341 RepID=A0ABT4J444_9RHOB|nr:DUF58 domain-containing protein [Paracoccus sp. EF6]MCZ0961166.1 DUF58 domain-containing protein [Paracoccus sp. EF6]